MIELRNLSYRYPKSSALLLEDLNYRFEAGRSYAVTGRSGSGKTTLLSLLSGFDTPTAGAVLVQGRDLREWDADAYRAKTVGVIFQNYNLLAHLNAAENVQLALRLAGVPDPPEAALALHMGATARDLAETIHAHPTLAEGVFEAAHMI